MSVRTRQQWPLELSVTATSEPVLKILRFGQMSVCWTLANEIVENYCLLSFATCKRLKSIQRNNENQHFLKWDWEILKSSHSLGQNPHLHLPMVLFPPDPFFQGLLWMEPEVYCVKPVHVDAINVWFMTDPCGFGSSVRLPQDLNEVPVLTLSLKYKRCIIHLLCILLLNRHGIFESLTGSP